MSDATKIVMVMSIIFGILVWIGYHRFFIIVFYEDVARGLFFELLISFAIGAFLASALVYFYWVVVILVLFIGIIISVKIENRNKKIAILIGFTVFAIILFIFGRNIKKDLMTQSNVETEEISTSYNDYKMVDGLDGCYDVINLM